MDPSAKNTMERQNTQSGVDTNKAEKNRIANKLKNKTLRKRAGQEVSSKTINPRDKTELATFGITGKTADLLVKGDYAKVAETPEGKEAMMKAKAAGLLDGDNSDDWKKINEAEIREFEELYGLISNTIKIGALGNPIYSGDSPNLQNLDMDNVPEKDREKLREILNTAVSQLGIDELSGAADKYLGGQSSKAIPWCAGFVNWVLKENSLEGSGSLAAKSFINGAGKGHVGFKIGDKVLGGNQGNRVSLKPLKTGRVVGWVLPTNLKDIHRKGDPDFDPNNIPDGAIVVFDRSSGKGKNSET